MSRLNVLWVIDHVCFDGGLHGGGRLYRNLLPAFDAERVRVFPYFLRASEDVEKVFETAPVPVTNLAKGRLDPTTFLTLYNLCRRHEIDVMHLMCYAASTFGRMVGAATGIPTIIHDFDTQTYFPYPAYLKVADRVLARATSHSLAASPMCRDYMRDTRRVPGDIDILPHAIPRERFETAASLDLAAARTQLGWSPDDVVFAAVTKLGPDRGNEYLLRAFARVAAERPRARLSIVYKPTYYHRLPDEYQGRDDVHDTARMRRDLDELIAGLGIGGKVHLAESLDRPDAYFAGSDVLVMPFLHERFSSVYLLEGFVHGKPAIVTNLGEQREVVEDGVNGLLVPPGGEDALVAAMLRLLDDPAARARMGEGAAALARRFSVDAAAARLTDLYARLAARRVEQAGLAPAAS